MDSFYSNSLLCELYYGNCKYLEEVEEEIAEMSVLYRHVAGSNNVFSEESVSKLEEIAKKSYVTNDSKNFMYQKFPYALRELAFYKMLSSKASTNADEQYHLWEEGMALLVQVIKQTHSDKESIRYLVSEYCRMDNDNLWKETVAKLFSFNKDDFTLNEQAIEITINIYINKIEDAADIAIQALDFLRKEYCILIDEAHSLSWSSGLIYGSTQAYITDTIEKIKYAISREIAGCAGPSEHCFCSSFDSTSSGNNLLEYTVEPAGNFLVFEDE